MSAACVSDALVRLDGMALAGSLPDDVAYKAEAIAAGWWWNAHGDLTPDRLVLLVQELQRWCVVAAGHYALRWDDLNRVGLPWEAEDAARWALRWRSTRRSRPCASMPSGWPCRTAAATQ